MQAWRADAEKSNRQANKEKDYFFFIEAKIAAHQVFDLPTRADYIRPLARVFKAAAYFRVEPKATARLVPMGSGNLETL